MKPQDELVSNFPRLRPTALPTPSAGVKKAPQKINNKNKKKQTITNSTTKRGRKEIVKRHEIVRR